MLIHHSGKDSGRGARGHSALRGAIDTEIRLTRDDDSGVITADLTKQRDGPTGISFRCKLARVHLGYDSDGDAVASRTVMPLIDDREG